MARIFRRVAITFLAVFFTLCFVQWCGNRPVSLRAIDAEKFAIIEHILTHLNPLMKEEDIVSLRIRDGVISYLNEFSGERKILTSGELFDFLKSNRENLEKIQFDCALLGFTTSNIILPVHKLIGKHPEDSRIVYASYDPDGKFREGEIIPSRCIKDERTKVVKRVGNIVILVNSRTGHY